MARATLWRSELQKKDLAKPLQCAPKGTMARDIRVWAWKRRRSMTDHLGRGLPAAVDCPFCAGCRTKRAKLAHEL